MPVRLASQWHAPLVRYCTHFLLISRITFGCTALRYIVALRLEFSGDDGHTVTHRRVEILVRYTSHTKVFHHAPKQQGGPGAGMVPWVEDDDVAEKERQALAEEVPVDVEYVDSVTRDAAHPKLLVLGVGGAIPTLYRTLPTFAYDVRASLRCCMCG